MARGGGFVASGIQNIRAPIALPQPRRVTQGTYIDAADDVDHSADARLYCHLQDTGGVDRRTYLKFKSIAFPADGVLYLIGFYDNYIKAGVSNFFLDPSIALATSSVQFYVLAYGITDWGGLDVDTIRWGTRTTPTYTAQIGVQLCQWNVDNGTDPGGGQPYAYHAPVPGLILTGTPGDSIRGLLLQGSLNWQNIFYSGGYIYGNMDFVNPATKPLRILSGLDLR
jgi:hypothetical protein